MFTNQLIATFKHEIFKKNSLDARVVVAVFGSIM